MKGFAKKLFAVGISASIVFSTVMSVGVNAASVELLNEDFTAQTELNGWTYTNSKGNETQTDAFKLKDGLEIYTGQKKNGVDKIEKSFQKISAGDTLRITGKLLMNGLDWYSGQTAAIKIGNGTDNWSLLQLYVANAGPIVGAAAKNTAENNGWSVKGSEFDFSGLHGEDNKNGFEAIKGSTTLNYTATLAPSENGYTLTASLGLDAVEDLSIELSYDEAVSIDRVYIATGADNDVERKCAIRLSSMQVKRNINEKPVLTFGNKILFDNSGERLNENFAAWSSFDGVVGTSDDEDYSRGAKWLYSNVPIGESKGGKFGETFKLNENKLEVYAGAHTGGVEKLEKKFNPISSGDTLKITGTVFLNGLTWSTGQSVAIKIGNDTDNWSLLQLYNGGKSAPNVAAAEKNRLEHNGFGIGDDANKFDLSKLQWGFDSIKNATINYTATLAPSENGYTLTASLGLAAVEDVSIELSKEDALSLDRIYIASGFCNNYGKSCGLKIENLKVEAIGTKTTLTNGKNTLYIPMKNLNGGAADMTVIAALCNADGTQETYALKDYKGLTDYNQNLAIDIDVRDSSTQYVRIFVFDSVQSMVPLTGAKSTKN